MDKNTLNELLNGLKEGKYSNEETVELIKSLTFKDLGFAKVDTHRSFRQGYPEAIYSPGKSAEQIIHILLELKKTAPVILASKVSEEIANKVTSEIKAIKYDQEAKMLIYGDYPEEETSSYALVLTAGTVDIPIAKESIITLKSCGVKVKSSFDCGIAGIHRLFSQVDLIRNAKAIIVIAGMEGALASIVGGISPCPVIAVPTSNGYGAHLNGIAPLLTMLNSCSSCVSVVNIDNGYSAGIIASLIVKQSCK